MFLTRDDFRIKASNFNLLNGWNILRIFAGFCMIPHALSKFTNGVPSAGTVAFFAKAGIEPAAAMVWVAASAEMAIGIFMILGICTRYAALGGAAVLAMAIYAIQVTKGFGWLWNFGGHEYNVFWALVFLSIALEEFKRVCGNCKTTH